MWAGSAPVDRLARTLLFPFEAAFRTVVALRGVMYQSGFLKIQRSGIPVISIGNLTVGGTGKTPVAAWIASRLAARGRAPAVVLRGYGGDETMVHRILNPSIPVVEAADRVSGIQLSADSGADIAILDDAFQHRRAARDADLVLIGADDWTGEQRLLPAGPYREPLAALKRASAVIITCRTAGDDTVEEIERAVRAAAPAAPVAVVRLEIGDLINFSSPDQRLDVSVLLDRTVLAVAAIGNSRAFFRQLAAAGARVTTRAFPDHHQFTPVEIQELATLSSSCDYVVCTLKDAVKLGVHWPADAGPLWYVSLSVKVVRGGSAIDEIISTFDSARDI